MKSVLITGANRGIGLNLARLHKAAGWNVVGTYRDEARSKDLISLLGEQALQLDVKDEKAIAALPDTLKTALTEFESLDRLINNAGIFGPRTNFHDLAAANWLDVFHVNAVAPTQLAYALRNAISSGGEIINISSKMASIELCGGDAPIYRSSKTALNMAMACLQKEFADQNISVFLMHPGWVRTDMGGGDADLSVKESASRLFETMNGFVKFPVSDQIGFYNYDGAKLPY